MVFFLFHQIISKSYHCGLRELPRAEDVSNSQCTKSHGERAAHIAQFTHAWPWLLWQPWGMYKMLALASVSNSRLIVQFITNLLQHDIVPVHKTSFMKALFCQGWCEGSFFLKLWNENIFPKQQILLEFVLKLLILF